MKEGRLSVKRLSLDRGLFLWFTGLFLVTCGLFKIFLMPQISELHAVREQYRSQMALIAERKETAGMLDTLASYNRKMRADLNEVNKRFIKEKELTDFSASLIALAESTGNHLDSVDAIRRSKEEGDSPVQEMQGRFQFSGMYPALVGFLKELYDHEKMLILTDLAITSIEDSQELDLSFVLKLYMTSQVQEGPPVEESAL